MMDWTFLGYASIGLGSAVLAVGLVYIMSIRDQRRRPR